MRQLLARLQRVCRELFGEMLQKGASSHGVEYQHHIRDYLTSLSVKRCGMENPPAAARRLNRYWRPSNAPCCSSARASAALTTASHWLFPAGGTCQMRLSTASLSRSSSTPSTSRRSRSDENTGSAVRKSELATCANRSCKCAWVILNILKHHLTAATLGKTSKRAK